MVTLADRVKVTTTSTGTGQIALGSAESGYQTFADAGIVDAATVRYVIEDGSAWEIGTGTYTASGALMSRTLVDSSTGSLLNLSGSATVFLSVISSDLQELVTFASNFTLPSVDGTSGQALITNGSGGLTFEDTSGAYTEVNVSEDSIDSDVTISGTQRAMSVGPITVTSGVTVTVQTGGRYVVL